MATVVNTGDSSDNTFGHDDSLKYNLNKMTGKAGNDTYYVDNSADTVTEAAGSANGNDTVIVESDYYIFNSPQFTLAANVENLDFRNYNIPAFLELIANLDIGYTDETLAKDLEYLKTNKFVVNGNASDNTILTNAESAPYVKILAGAGNDTIVGSAGTDEFDGGLGIDSLYGASGNDILFGGNDTVSDSLLGGAGNDTYVLVDSKDTIIDHDGSNTIELSSSFKDSGLELTGKYSGGMAQIGTLDASDVTKGLTLVGNLEVGTTILGGNGNDTITGGLGNDIISGNAGNDSISGDMNSGLMLTTEKYDGSENLEQADTYTYDSDGKILTCDTSYGGSNDHELNTYTYDSKGNQLIESIKFYDISTGETSSEISYEYTFDKKGRILTKSCITDEAGSWYYNDSYTYNTKGYVATKETLTFEVGQGTSPLYREVRAYTYDSKGNKLTYDYKNYENTSTVVAIHCTNTYTYDAKGNALTNTYLMYDGNTTNVQYQSIYTCTYDSNGNRLTELNEYHDETNPTSDAIDSVTYTYDGNGNKLTVAFENRDSFGVVMSHSLMTYSYDESGNLLAETEIQYMGNTTDIAGTTTYSYTNTYISGGNDNIEGNAGNDTIFGGGGNNIIDGGAGNDSLFGGNGINTIYGGAGNDTIATTAGNGDSSHKNYFDGGAGNDTYLFYGNEAWTEYADASGTDTIKVMADENGKVNNSPLALIDLPLVDPNSTIEKVDGSSITGTDLNITGNAADNIIIGGSGNDTINGGLGADNMTGGLGNDTYYIDNAKDTITEGKDGGNDTVAIETFNASKSKTITIGNNIENLDLRDLSLNLTDDEKTYLSTHKITINGNASDNTIYTNADNANYLKISAGVGNDTVYGSSGDDSVDAGAGDDVIYSGGGRDTIVGGAGNDTYIYGEEVLGGGAMSITDASGIDTIKLDFDGALGALEIPMDDTSGIENFDGSSITTAGGTSLIIEGNKLNNEIIGGSGLDNLSGGAGDDTLYGGNDTLADALNGGVGNDTYVIQDTKDIIVDTSGSNTIKLGAHFAGTGVSTSADELAQVIGNDGTFGYDYTKANITKIDASAVVDAYAADLNNISALYLDGSDNVAMTIIGGSGTDYILSGLNSGDDLYYGGDGDDMINSRDGNDKLYGGNGNDYLGGGAGNDTLYGDDGDDYLSGWTGNDALYGGAGDDTLAGGIGTNILDGGSGDDTYWLVGNETKTTIKDSSGTDTIELYQTAVYSDMDPEPTYNYAGGLTKASFSLAGYSMIENLSAAGVHDVKVDFTLTGNNLDNEITGSIGNDTLIGGKGDDTYFFNTGGGKDLVVASDSATSNDVINISSDISKNTDILFYTDKSGNFFIDYTDDGVGSDIIEIESGKYNDNTTIQIGNSTININSIVEDLGSYAGLSGTAISNLTLDNKAAEYATLTWTTDH